MNHLSEEQLILHYYGETDDAAAAGDTLAAERHLEECGACRALYASLQRVLNVVDGLPVPERSADYGAQVWQRIEHRLGTRRRTLWMLPASWRWAAAGAAFAALMVTAFVAGRFYPRHNQPAQMAAADAQTGERVLLVAVGDYLERSQMVLIELTNANPKGSMDISAEQERAGDLVTETRPVPADRRAHRRYPYHGRTRRTRARAGGYYPRALQYDPASVGGTAPTAGGRRHSLQDSRAGLQRPQPGSCGRADAPPDTLKGKGT